jgi:hypothetical protein
MPDAHSKHSASNFEANTLCPGRPVMCKGLPDRSSKYAEEGTKAHSLLEQALLGELPLTADADMAGHVKTALDAIHEIVGDGLILPEQRVNYASYLGVPSDDAWGTSDVIGVRGDELIVIDFKYGMGVEVSAEANPQMMLYGLGALNSMNDTLGPFERVRMVILQPRIKSAPSEWTITVEELEAWCRGEAARSVQEQLGAERLFEGSSMSADEWQRVYLRPNEKSCKFCKAKATCPALRAEVSQVVFLRGASIDEFSDDQPVGFKDSSAGAKELSRCLAKVDLIEEWCKAVRAEVERRLLAAEPVPGFKLVEGKQGNRAWSDAAAAEKMLREQFRLKVEDAYDLKLISPTTAEKLVKAGTIGPRQWKSAEALITRAPGKKHVAPVSDPRPALSVTPAADDFETVADATQGEFA